MKTRTRKVLTAVLTAVVIVGLAGWGWIQLGYLRGSQEYSKAQEMVNQTPEEPQDEPEEQPEENQPVIGMSSQEAVTEPQEEPEVKEEDSYAQALVDMELKPLQDVNSDVIGWIQIPDTPVSYPLMQGTDNEYYLKYTWEKKWNYLGSIFLDCVNSRDLSDFNSIVYGHNMNNSMMFGDLVNFRDSSFLEQHPYVYIADEQGCRRYRIFAAYEVSVATAESYQTTFKDDADKQAFIDKCLAMSEVKTDIVPAIEDNLLTLSTCTGVGFSTRWVVQAVLDFHM